MPSLTEPVRQSSAHDLRRAHDEEYAEASAESQRTIDHAITECRSLYRHRLINTRTRQEYDKMWEGLRAQGELEKMQENVHFLYEAVAEAIDYEADFKREMKKAHKNKWIGDESNDRWMARFNDENVLEWDRKTWLKNNFHVYVAGWERVGKKQSDIEKFAKHLGVNAKQVPELKNVLTKSEFLSFEFPERDRMATTAWNALLQKEENFNRARAIFTDATQGPDKCLDPKNVDHWLKMAMKKSSPEAYAQKLIASWKSLRRRFDAVNKQMDKEGISEHFERLSPENFWSMPIKHREHYLKEAAMHLLHQKENKEKGKVNETKTELPTLKTRIESGLRMQDWDKAKQGLAEARKIAPQDRELDHMERFLNRYADPHVREQKNKTPSLKETLEARDRLRHFVRFEAGTSVQHSYAAVMAMGYRQTKRFLQLMYNRVWVHERGYSNQLLDMQEGSSKGNKQKTEERIENGHEWYFEHNIIEGNTAQKEAIRDECKKPQVLHMGRDGQQAVIDKVRANCDNEQFGYWTTLVPKELSYAKHSEIVKNFHYQIKCDMKLLEQAGMAFTLTDEVPLTHAA